MKFAVHSFRRNALIALAITATIPAVSHAESRSESISKEKGISMGVGATLGAIVGGPAGFVAGTMLGGILGDNTDQSIKLSNQEAEMNRAAVELQQLEDQISQMDLSMSSMETEFAELEQALLTRLEFQVLFRTGDDRLREQDRERISMLAKYMRRNPEVSVRLEGHADARGTEEYNAVLAEYRAKAVADALFARGVPADRVDVKSMGSSKATAQPGDYEGYALDRHVNIEVIGKSELAEQTDAGSKELALAQ